MKSIKTFLQSISLTIITAIITQQSYSQWSEDPNYIWNSSTGKNVGIGISNPTEALTVNGAIRVTGQPIYFLGDHSDPNYLIQSGTWDDGMKYKHFTSHQFFTQNIERLRITSDGYIGIGMTNPGTNLQVDREIMASYNSEVGPSFSLKNNFKTGDQDATTWRIYNMGGGYGNSLQFWGYSNTANLGPKLVIKDDGKVGIGTITPDAIFHAKGGTAMTGGWNRTAVLEATYPVLVFNSNNTKWAGIGYDYSSNFNIWVNASTNDVVKGMIALGINNVTGNIGIGASPSSDKLTVNGNIKAKKLTVTQNGWADYVFDKEYKLMNLNDLSNYIQQHKHLPEIPSTKDIETNGVDVGTNQALLLKKIEELTLYIIEQQKEIEVLKKKIK